MKYCFLDLETTGFNPEKDSIIEVSFICVDDNKVVDKFDRVYIPDKSKISKFVSKLTGITEEEVLNSKNEIKNDILEIKKKIKDRIIVGHNIDFDIKFLLKNGVKIKENKRIDTHELARILLPKEESFALEILSQKYKFSHNNAHRAMSDVIASWNLFKLLNDKINNLPKEYLNKINNFLKEKTNWYAKELFLKTEGNEQEIKIEKIEKKQIKIEEIPENFNKKYNSDNLFIHIGNNKASSNLYKNIAKKYNKKNGDKFLIITPNLNFFPEIKQFPTPEVILDPVRLKEFKDNRKILNNSETTFYLKCCYRNFLGFRGVDKFDLFFKERDLWKEICINNKENNIYKKIIKEREDNFCLTLSINAFFRFNNLDLFKNRILIIDEAEQFAENLLYEPIKKYSFENFLNSKDENIINKTHFFITRCCKELIEPKLEHKISEFPQKIILGEYETFEDIANEVNDFEESELNDFVVSNLKNPEEKIVRFIEYFPKSGDLSFNFWHPDDWRKKKEILSKFKKIIGHRTEIIGESMPFFRIFLGISSGEKILIPNNFTKKELIIPKNLISHNSPDYNNFCVDKITKIFKENNKSSLAVNFSSLESLRKSYDELIYKDIDENLNFIVGEKVLGGDGKLIQLLQKNSSKRLLFLFKKFMYQEIWEYDFKNIVIQKFPFNPPHPLLEKIESVLKNSGQNFFDIWVITQVAANLSRNLSNYTKTKKIYFLDPRVNTKWGNSIIRRGFNKFLQ